MPKATLANIEGLYQAIVDDDDFILKESKRSDIYERMKHRDGHVASCWSSRISPVTSAEWSITSEDERQQEVLTEQIENFPDWQQYNETLLDAVFRGYAGVEWELHRNGDENGCIVKEALSIDQDNITFTGEGMPRLLTQAHPYDGEPMPFPQFTVISWGDRKHGNRRGKGVAQGIFWAWFFKVKGFKFWATALERFGMPSLKAKVKGADFAARRARWLKMLRDYVGGSGIVYEEGEDVSDIGNVGTIGGSNKMFEDFFNAEISKRILGQTLTTEQGQRGSQALGKIHNAVREDILWSDSIWLAQGVHSRYTLPALGFYLFGDAYVPAKFEYVWEDPEAGQRGAERLRTLKDVGLPMRRRDVYQMADVPEPEEGDELFEWPKAPVSPPFGPSPFASVDGQASEGFTEGITDRRRESKRGQRDMDDLTLADTVKAVSEWRAGMEQFKQRVKKNGPR